MNVDSVYAVVVIDVRGGKALLPLVVTDVVAIPGAVISDPRNVQGTRFPVNVVRWRTQGRARIDEEARTSGKMLAKSKTEASQTAKDLKEIRKKYEGLKSKSDRVLEISDERDRLAAENEELAAQATEASEKVGGLTQLASIKWFLAGAAVLIAGWFLGVVTGRKRRKSGFTVG